MATSTNMVYGAYTFEPVPLITINKEIVRTGDGVAINEVTRMTLTGTLVATSQLVGPNGLEAMDTAIESLRDAFKDDCQLFLVQCDATTIIQAYPRITSVQIDESPDNWVFTAPFTIEMEFEAEVGETYTYTENVRSVGEQWDLEFTDDSTQHEETVSPGGLDHIPYGMRLTHTVNAEATRPCVSGGLGQEGWKEARDWVINRIGYDGTGITDCASGTINIDTTGLGQFNHMRTKNMDEVNGSFSVTETWLLINTGSSGLAGNALEDFTVSISTSLNEPLARVTVEGSIQGLESRSYGSDPGDFNITTTKYDAATTYWTNVQSKLYGRANTVSGGLGRPIILSPALTSIGHNKSKGVITYNYEYNNRVCFLLDSGSLSGQVLSEIISINDNNPTDVFASIAVLGRVAGPVLQEISTVTEKTREVSVEVLVQPTGTCDLSDWLAYGETVSGEVANILCTLQTDLEGKSDQVFKHSDQASWTPREGRYSRQIGWTYQNCSDTNDTSVC